MTIEVKQDRFELRIFFRKNPLQNWETMRPILEVLLQQGEPLAPSRFHQRYDKNEPLSLDVVARQFRRQKSPDVLVFTGEHGVAIEWTGYPPRNNPASKLIMRIPCSLLTTSTDAEKVTKLTAALCRVCPPVYGWGHPEEDVRLGQDPHVTDAWAPRQVYEAYWLMILGAAMVKKLKRALVSATPARSVDFLEDGSALIVTSPLPNEALSRTAREAQAATLAHLCPERKYDEIFSELLGRSLKLEPLERRWDPEVNQLFQIIVDAVPLAERRAKEIELNAHLPPEITEWRQAGAVLPADVDDVAATVDSYHRQAQTFVAGYHDQITKLMAMEPDCLPWIDAHFYLRDYPRTKDLATLERLMIPTLGALLGTLLERFLDGRWVPRRSMEESQVIVGDRVWLPFLRVKRFLQSKQAALDYSLTRYYFEVERHTSQQTSE